MAHGLGSGNGGGGGGGGGGSGIGSEGNSTNSDDGGSAGGGGSGGGGTGGSSGGSSRTIAEELKKMELDSKSPAMETIGEQQPRRRYTSRLEALPDELFMHIISFLPPHDLVALHETSNRSRDLTRRDPHLWRNVTIHSHEEQLFQERRPVVEYARYLPIDMRGGSATINSVDGGNIHTGIVDTVEGVEGTRGCSTDGRGNLGANNGRLDWYEEWKWRFAPLRMEWLDHHHTYRSRNSGGNEDNDDGFDDDDEDDDEKAEDEPGDLEVRGVTAFSSIPSEDAPKDMLFSPLSDGSVAVFDLRRYGRRRRRREEEIEEEEGLGGRGGGYSRGGPWRLSAKSRRGLVSVETSTGRGSYMTGNHASPGGATLMKKTTAPSGVVDCVSVDSVAGKGWVAVEGRLIEIDLNTLQRTATHPFAFTITALSQTSSPFPLTVCTTNMVHLHDPRISPSTNPSNSTTTANLYQTGAVSILHSNNGRYGALNTYGGSQDSIYIAGRFQKLLVYERRVFPKLRTLGAGGKLTSLSAFPFLVEDGGEGSGGSGRVGEAIVAGGENNDRGGLEIYPPGSLVWGTGGGSGGVDSGGHHSQHHQRQQHYFNSHHHHHQHPHHQMMPGGSNNLNHHQHPQHNPTSRLYHTVSGVSPNGDVSTMLSPPAGGGDGASVGSFSEENNTIIRNWQTASLGRIWAVDARQGSSIITGDQRGVIRWVERDGQEEVRRFGVFDAEVEEDYYDPEVERGGAGGRGYPGGSGGAGEGASGDGEGEEDEDPTLSSRQPLYRPPCEAVKKVIGVNLGGGGGGGSGNGLRKGTSAGGDGGLGTVRSMSGTTVGSGVVVVWTGERLGVVSVGQSSRFRRRGGPGGVVLGGWAKGRTRRERERERWADEDPGVLHEAWYRARGR